MSTVIEKTNVLRKEFLELEVNHDELITINQLFMLLDRKARKQFDRDVGQQLHDRMTQDYKGRITIDEFIKVWLQAEEILKNKIESCKKCLQDYHRQRKQASIKLEVAEARIEERVNLYGVMEGSRLAVTLVNGENFQIAPFYAMMQLVSQKIETGQSHGPTPVWNQTFTFDIETGLEELQIFFISLIHPQNPNLLGTLTISLSSLVHQNKTEEVYTLYSKEGQPTQQKVRLGLHWLYSTTKYLEEVVNRWNESIQQQEDDLLDYERDLATLYEPFPSLVKIYHQLKPEDLTQRGPNKQPMNTFVVTAVSVPQNLPQDLLTVSRVLTIAILSFALLSSFYKAVYLDILICFAFITCYERQLMNKVTIQQLCASFVFSMILDVAWLVIYSKNWWYVQDTSTQQHDTANLMLSPEIGFLRVVLLMVYLGLFAKFINLVALAILGQRIDQITPVIQHESPNAGIVHNDISRSTSPQGF